MGTISTFQTVAEAERRARRRLPRDVYLALVAGKEAGVTAQDNVDAFGELRLNPAIADPSSGPSLSTSVMGFDVSLPVLISPTGAQAIHPEGEVAVARAATAVGTAMGLSSFASRSIEDVGSESDKLMLQLYWIGTRGDMLQRIERARAAGIRALIITLDWVFTSRRDWGAFVVPDRVNVRTAMRFGTQMMARPRYVATWMRAGKLPDLTVPNLSPLGGPVETFATAYQRWRDTPPPTWEDIAWLRERWGGPFMVKGVTRVQDAIRSLDIGATAISVSNHGGNNLDSTPATIRCLPAIAEAVDGQMEVLLDGGVRRGSDVVMAIALGAKAVMIGRAYLWGLAADGERGVTRVLEILRDGMSETLSALAYSSPAALKPHDVYAPHGFEHRAPDAP